jgi:hypothetical protein
VYLSERKLFNLAPLHDVSTTWFQRNYSFSGSGGVMLPLVPGTGLSIKAKAEAERVQPRQREHAVEQILERVLSSLERDGISELDAGDGQILEGGWFRFHRHLRFGAGSDDSTQSIKALVLVDRQAVDEHGGEPGLLMFGDAGHLRAPYYSEELCNGPGRRSGSSTGVLFAWLQEVRRALEEDPRADLDSLRKTLADRPREGGHAASTMYQLFARDDWMDKPRFPQLLHHAPCEGIAQASLIAAEETLTVVMGSPLYVRVRGMPATPLS